jgi:S-DNA-T family DNA segregation ATPase FtsK/SpoIIIE
VATAVPLSAARPGDPAPPLPLPDPGMTAAASGAGLIRPERVPPVTAPTEPVPVPPPPRRDDGSAASGGAWQAILPALGSAAAMVFILGNPQPLMIVAGGLFVVAALGSSGLMVLVNHRSRYRQRNRTRSRYLDRLDQLDAKASAAAAAQRAEQEWRHPAPSQLLGLACSTRLWERRVGDPDHLVVRLGTTDQPRVAPLKRWEDNDDPSVELDPVLVRAAEDLLSRHGDVPDVPATVELTARSSTSPGAQAPPALVLRGDPLRARALARAIIAGLAATHTADDLQIAVASGHGTAGLGLQPGGAWGWIRWLPHHLDDLEDELAARAELGRTPASTHLVASR